MKKLLLATTLLAATQLSFAQEKVTVLLDWFVNPDHAALVVAKQGGYFEKYGLDVELIEPADPSLPPKLVAAGKGDMAVNYQPQLHMQVNSGLPLTRVGTLVSTPLNSLVVLKDSGIDSIKDLKGKTIGYSVSGFEESLLSVMLDSAGLQRDDVKWVNVNWSLSPSLMSGKVDAVYGAYRNFELNEMDIHNHPGKAFYPEEHGIPSYDELVLVVKNDRVNESKFDAFISAVEEATVYTINHPQESWEAFKSYKPKELDNELNRRAWKDTLPRLALRPRALDNKRYEQMAAFLKKHKMIEKTPAVDTYAVELPVK